MSNKYNVNDRVIVQLKTNKYTKTFEANIKSINNDGTYDITVDNRNSRIDHVDERNIILYDSDFNIDEKVIHNVPECSSPVSGGMPASDVTICITVSSDDMQTNVSVQSATNLPQNNQALTSIPTTKAYTIIKYNIKEIINELNSNNNNINLQELLELAKDNIKKNVPLMAELTNDIKNNSKATLSNRILSANPLKSAYSGFNQLFGNKTVTENKKGGKKRRKNKTVKRSRTRR